MSYTKEELKRYIDNFYNLNENELLRVKAIITEMINRDKYSMKDNWLELEEAELLSLYAVKYFCELLEYEPCKVEFVELPKSKGGHYDKANHIIRINITNLKDKLFGKDLQNSYPDYGGRSNDILHVIFTSMHECQHYIQDIDSKGDTLTTNSMYFSSFRDTEEEEYSNKYDFFGIENLANKLGWSATALFIAHHADVNHKKNNDVLLKKANENLSAATAYVAMANQTDKIKETGETEEIERLLRIAKMYNMEWGDEWEEFLPSYLTGLFTNKGDLKPTQQLINIYNSLIPMLPEGYDEKTMEMLSTYEDIIAYALLTRKYEVTVNNDKVLENILKKEISKVFMMSRIPETNNDFSKGDFVFMISERLNRFLSLLGIYLNSGNTFDSSKSFYHLSLLVLDAFNNTKFREKYDDTIYSKKMNYLLDTLGSIVNGINIVYFNDIAKVDDDNIGKKIS